MSDLFRLFSSNVGCVLLNACYSEEQANAIVNHIDYVIGMNQEIRDDAAIAFSKGFYRALGYDCSIEEAFEFGKNAIQLEISGSSRVRSAATEQQRMAEVVNAVQREKIPEHLKPILRCKPTLNQSASRVVFGSEQPLSEAKREEIQLEVANALAEDSSSQQQYREKVREFLSDRKLTKFDEIRLEQLRKSLGLSVEEANQILVEEHKPIQQARDDYEEMLIRLIDEGHYPFDAGTQADLREFRQELQLTDEEVTAISNPILEAAEEEYQEKLKQQEQQRQRDYQAKVQRYEQEFRRAIQVGYPIDSFVREGLRQFQQSLGLSDEDIARIEEPIVAPKEAVYQRQLAEEQRRQEEARRQLELKRQQELEEQQKLEEQQRQRDYQAKVQRYEQEFRRAIQVGYPIDLFVREGLRQFQQSLGLSDEDIARIEEPIIAPKEAVYQRQLAEEQRRQEEARRQLERKRQQELEERQRQQEYRLNLQRYEQEFRKAIEAQYPIQDFTRNALKVFQQSFNLNDDDVARIEEPIVAPKEAAYQRQLAEEQRRQVAAKRQLELERQQELEQRRKLEEQQRQRDYQAKVQRYEKDFRRAIESKYPISSDVRDELRQFQQFLQLSNEDIARIEKPICEPFEQHNQGLQLYFQGKLSEAIAAYRRAIQINPNDSTTHNDLGFALYKQGKLDDAVAAYRRAIQINPNDSTTHNNLGNALEAQGKLDDAVAAYRQAIQINPNRTLAHKNLGNALYKQGKLDDAISAYRQALQISPNDADARKALEIALGNQRKKLFGLF